MRAIGVHSTAVQDLNSNLIPKFSKTVLWKQPRLHCNILWMRVDSLFNFFKEFGTGEILCPKRDWL